MKNKITDLKKYIDSIEPEIISIIENYFKNQISKDRISMIQSATREVIEKTDNGRNIYIKEPEPTELHQIDIKLNKIFVAKNKQYREVYSKFKNSFFESNKYETDTEIKEFARARYKEWQKNNYDIFQSFFYESILTFYSDTDQTPTPPENKFTVLNYATFLHYLIESKIEKEPTPPEYKNRINYITHLCSKYKINYSVNSINIDIYNFKNGKTIHLKIENLKKTRELLKQKKYKKALDLLDIDLNDLKKDL